MRRIIKILITVLLISPLSAFPARAAEVTLVPSDQTVAVGDTFSVNLTFSPDEGEELAGGVIALGYDAGVVEILEVAIDPYWDFKPDPGSETGDGRWEDIGFDVFENTPVTDTVVIATITLKALAAGTSQLAVLNTSRFFSATVEIFPTVTNATIRVNTPPVADAQALTTAEDTAIAVTLTGSDIDGASLTYTVVDNPTNGTLSGSAPSLTYTPNADFNGSDSFTFRVSDGIEDSTPATVSITVTAVNDAPTADAQALTTAEDTAIAFTLTGSDIDSVSLTFSVVAGPSNGTLSGPAPNLTYTPAANFSGTDSFTFKVNDGSVDSIPATVSITVTPLNSAPVVNAGTDQTADEGAVVTFTGSFTDPGLDSHTVQWNFGDGATTTGTLTPTHTYADNGVYTVILTVTDDSGAVGTDTLTVTVINVAPLIIELSADEIIKTEEAISASCSFTDPGDDAWTAAIDFGDGVQETLALNQNKSFTFSHTYSSIGLHTVLVMISDDDGGEDGDDLIVAVTGDSDCIRGKGFWAHQFSDNGKHQIDDATLQAYLYIIDRFSSVFSENISMTTIEEAKLVFWPAGGGKGKKDQDLAKKEQALEHFLATWLNFADGAVSLETPVDTDFDSVPDMTFAEAIQWAESILNDPDSDKADFILVKDICESINTMGACN